jgi:hypothetical protein
MCRADKLHLIFARTVGLTRSGVVALQLPDIDRFEPRGERKTSSTQESLGADRDNMKT